jgi:hypothetical protein
MTGMALVGPNPGDFGQTSNCGSSVGTGANCAINVTFTPAQAGARSASLRVGDNASSSPQTVSLSGTGANPPTPAGTYSLAVVASDASTNYSHSVQVTVNVK